MYRIYDNSLINGPYEGFKKVLEGKKSFLAPELMNCIRHEE
jgi:hypothetical protein